MSGKAVYIVGKVCIFYYGENPYKNGIYCREGMTRVNTVVRAGRLKDAGCGQPHRATIAMWMPDIAILK